MRRRLLAVSLAAVVPLASAGVARADHGGFTLSPTSGPAGTTLTVSDDEGQCEPPEGATDPFVGVLLFDRDGEALNGNDADLTGAGNFTLSLSVPRGTPTGTLDVAVACFEGNDEDEDPFFVFDERAFRVTAAGSSPTTAPTKAPAGPAKNVPVTKPQAPAGKGKAPAAAVKAQPTFTG